MLTQRFVASSPCTHSPHPSQGVAYEPREPWGSPLSALLQFKMVERVRKEALGVEAPNKRVNRASRQLPSPR